MNERIALVKILELAKLNKQFANTTPEETRWERVAKVAFAALGQPSIADLDKLKTEAAWQEYLLY